MTVQVGSMTFSTHSSNDSQPESLMTCLPRWDATTIEVVGIDAHDVSIGWKTHNKKTWASSPNGSCP